ncbi:MAG: hypothetical protein ACOYO1_14815 [Bacteroidales bacterium]
MKKVIFACIMCILIQLSVNAQIDLRFLSANQEMVYKATDSAFVILRMDYVLQSSFDKSKIFGREGNSFFGSAYTLAVFADNKLWCSSSILKPWNNDPNYVEYKNVDSLKPILSKSYIRYTNQTKYTEISFDSISYNDSLTINTGIVDFSPKRKFSGLKLFTANPTDGWLVVAYSDKEFALNDTCSIKWAIYKENPEFGQAENIGKVGSPSVNGKIIGGVFINLKYQMGLIEFKLGGILHKQLINWVVSGINSKMEAQISTKPDKVDITPIKPIIPKKNNPNSKNKKNK